MVAGAEPQTGLNNFYGVAKYLKLCWINACSPGFIGFSLNLLEDVMCLDKLIVTSELMIHVIKYTRQIAGQLHVNKPLNTRFIDDWSSDWSASKTRRYRRPNWLLILRSQQQDRVLINLAVFITASLAHLNLCDQQQIWPVRCSNI